MLVHLYISVSKVRIKPLEKDPNRNVKVGKTIETAITETFKNYGNNYHPPCIHTFCKGATLSA